MSTLKTNAIQKVDGSAFKFGHQWTYGTPFDYSTTSGTDASMSGWTSDWQHIRISFVNLSSNANAYMQCFVSTSSNSASRITSGYEYSASHRTGGTSGTSMIQFYGTSSSAYDMVGELNLYRFGDSRCRFKGQLASTSSSYTFFVDGHVPVTCDNMTHVFLRSQGYSWDSGIFKVDYLA